MDDELQQILIIIKQHAEEGIKIKQIIEKLEKSITERTLLRRLSTLKTKGEIESIGTKSATRYYPKQSPLLLPLSAAAQLLKQQIKKPIQQRNPVTYNRDFLYNYQPNTTFYLTKAERKHLQQQGQQFNHELESGTYVKQILHRLLIDLSWNSSRLEGNTYSLLETERLIEFGTKADNKTAFEAQMIINHKATIEFMVACAHDLDFNKYIILNIHALLSNNLLANPKARGQLRQIPVGIGRTVYHPLEIPTLIAECFWHIVTTAAKIQDPFEQAFFSMVHLPYLQPFEDVNKRVSRLAANIPFIKHNLSPLSFIDVPKDDYTSGLLAIYELNKIELMRDVFIWSYERSAKQYKLTRNVLGEPNLLNLKFTQELQEIVSLIVTQNIRADKIVATIASWTNNHIDEPYREQFITIAEREIASLHLGNIAIYKISPELFAKWQKSI